MNSLRIRSNMTSALAYKNLSKTQHGLQTTLERLSSGLRINKSSDDIAGSAISTRMNNQIQGMKQANRNAQDVNNLLAAAESGLSDISDIVSRMRELSVQASTDTLNNTDRASLDLEYQSLLNEVTRIAESTRYNGTNLLAAPVAGSAETSESNYIDYSNNQTTISDKADGGGVEKVELSGAASGIYKFKINELGKLTLINQATNQQQTVSVSTPDTGQTVAVDFSEMGIQVTLNSSYELGAISGQDAVAAAQASLENAKNVLADKQLVVSEAESALSQAETVQIDLQSNYDTAKTNLAAALAALEQANVEVDLPALYTAFNTAQTALAEAQNQFLAIQVESSDAIEAVEEAQTVLKQANTVKSAANVDLIDAQTAKETVETALVAAKAALAEAESNLADPVADFSAVKTTVNNTQTLFSNAIASLENLGLSGDIVNVPSSNPWQVPKLDGSTVSFGPDNASITPDKRYIAFADSSDGWVDGDYNGLTDIFVHDRQTGTTERVSIHSDGTEAYGNSSKPKISADGQMVAFESDAWNLIDEDGNGKDIFVHNRQTGTTQRVNVHSDGTEANSSENSLHTVSPDGRHVVFNSKASNLSVDGNAGWNIYLRDLQTNTTSQVNLKADGYSLNSSGPNDIDKITDDFRYIFFDSHYDGITAYDIETGTTERLDVHTDGTYGNDNRYHTSFTDISPDGRYVAFRSRSTNLVDNDGAGVDNSFNLFLRDRETGTTQPISVGSDGNLADSSSGYGSMTSDGRYIVFDSVSNLVAEDTNGAVKDVFLRDMVNGTTERISVGIDGTQGNFNSFDPAISPDGRYVAFTSSAYNWQLDTNGKQDIYVHDRQTGVTERIINTGIDGAESNNNSYSPTISADGRYVAYSSNAFNLTGDDTSDDRDTFVHDRQTGITRLVSGNKFSDSSSPSISEDGQEITFEYDNRTAQVRNPLLSEEFQAYNLHSSSLDNISSSQNGRYVAYSSSASNLVDGDTNGQFDIFVHDQETGTTELVSFSFDGDQANGASYLPNISDDGRYITVTSDASNLVEGDTNQVKDIFVHDRETGTTQRINVHSDGTQANSSSTGNPSVSADGRYAVFQSHANNLVDNDTNNDYDIFVHDREAGTTERISVGTDGTQGNGNSYYPSITPDGRYVTFQSCANNLVDGGTGHWNVFVHDREAGTNELISVHSDGTMANHNSYESDSSNDMPKISDDGRYVLFRSDASNLVDNDTNDQMDLFVHDREMGTTERVNVHSNGTQSNQLYYNNGSAYSPSISPDGRHVVFSSKASNLVDGDTNEELDIFVHDRETGTTERISVTNDGNQYSDGHNSYYPSISDDGRYATFHHRSNVYVHDRQTGTVQMVNDTSYASEVKISGDGQNITFSNSDDSSIVKNPLVASAFTDVETFQLAKDAFDDLQSTLDSETSLNAQVVDAFQNANTLLDQALESLNTQNIFDENVSQAVDQIDLVKIAFNGLKTALGPLSEFTATVDQVEANLAEHETQLDQAQQVYNQADAEVITAEDQLESAQTEVDNYQDPLLTAATAVTAAIAEFKATADALEMAENGQVDTSSLQAAVDQAQAELDQAAADLDQAKIEVTSRQSTYDQAEAARKTAEEAVKTAQTNLNNIQNDNSDLTIDGRTFRVRQVGNDVRKTFQIGADNDVNSQLDFDMVDATANGLSIDGTNLLHIDSARNAITSLDFSLDKTNSERSRLGSLQNRLQFTVSNLNNQTQNIEAARSSIQDTDFAADAADLAKNQILAQSATAMLAQASALPQNILSLIAA